MKTFLGYLFLFLFIFSSCLIYPQCSQDQTYTNGVTEKLTPERLLKLRNILNSLGTGGDNKWLALKKYYFGDPCDPALPNILCYIKKGSPALVSLVKGNEKNISELFGERYVWVVIFSDYDLTTKEKFNEKKTEIIKTTTWKTDSVNVTTQKEDSIKTEKWELNSLIADTATIRIEVLDYEPGPREYSLSGIIKSLTSLVLGDKSGGISSPEQSLLDSTQLQKLKLVKFKSKDDSIYVEIKMFKIEINTKNRIVIKSLVKDSTSNFQYIFFNFWKF